jgi:hypothetical protein
MGYELYCHNQEKLRIVSLHGLTEGIAQVTLRLLFRLVIDTARAKLYK